MALWRTIQAGKLMVRMYDTRAEMGYAAAMEAASTLRRVIAEKGRANVIFAAAPSQNEFLQALLAAGDLHWDRVHAYHMDEYLGLPADAPQGFGNFLVERLFRHMPFASVSLINGNAADPEAECVRYAGLLAAAPPDMVCMGIGENGHIAFNDPPDARFDDPRAVRVVKLDETCRVQQVHDGCFPLLEKVPTHALTLTIPTLFSAPAIFCMVPAATKATAVRNTLQGPVTEQVPASILKTHANAFLFLDRDSASELDHERGEVR